MVNHSFLGSRTSWHGPESTLVAGDVTRKALCPTGFIGGADAGPSSDTGFGAAGTDRDLQQPRASFGCSPALDRCEFIPGPPAGTRPRRTSRASGWGATCQGHLGRIRVGLAGTLHVSTRRAAGRAVGSRKAHGEGTR